MLVYDKSITRSALSGRVEAVGVGTATTAFEYSGFGEVNLVTTTIGASEYELALTHHDKNRRITAKAETTDDVTTSRQYEYDSLGRLTAVRDGSNSLLERYTYDAQGRRVSGNGSTYTYNNDDQLLAVSGTAAYEYTDTGYRSYRYDGTGGCIGYAYTEGGQLVGVRRYLDDNGNWVLDANAPEITYTLDAAGRRVAKLVDGTIQERYLWAGHNTTLLAVYGPTSTTPIARFEYGVGRMPMRMTQGNATYYFAYDHVGSLRAVFDDAGALIHEITYDSYGNILSETSNSGLCIPFGFAGGLQDRDTDLVLFGFRDYDPETGVWMTQDPIGFAGGDTYLYAYCGGNPVNFMDPSGLDMIDPTWGYGVDLTPAEQSARQSVFESIVGTLTGAGPAGCWHNQLREIGGATEVVARVSMFVATTAITAAATGGVSLAFQANALRQTVGVMAVNGVSSLLSSAATHATTTETWSGFIASTFSAGLANAIPPAFKNIAITGTWGGIKSVGRDVWKIGVGAIMDNIYAWIYHSGLTTMKNKGKYDGQLLRNNCGVEM